jgi:signal transduction histidine kinase
MELTRRSALVYAILAAIWLVVLAWQFQEHRRVTEAAKADLRSRSKDIAKTVSAFIRGSRFRGVMLQERLEPALNELVNGRTNELTSSSELMGIKLFNAVGDSVASAGIPIDLDQKELVQEGERWGRRSVVLVNPVNLGASLNEGSTNPTVVISRHDLRQGESGGPGPAPPPNFEGGPPRLDGPPEDREQRRRDGEGRPRRPPWWRGMEEKEKEKRSLHGLVMVMSTGSLQALITRDLWLRSIIVFMATISVIGSGVAWRNLVKSSELQIRLVRVSEMNTHLKEMNLAAAGLAHETRNPLNIIRGLAQMISRREDAPPEVREKTRGIIAETDKVTAQLNEFINYSRPREVHRSNLALSSIINEVVRALTFDLEEKQVKLDVKGEVLTIEADEQLLRQALFNLILNAIQAVDGDGHIEVFTQKRNGAEGILEVRDNGPGVPSGQREEIFKPYFTMQKHGTGLGLAVVQQIVLAHDWEIQCLQNEPRGAVFRISHLKVAGG